MKDRSVQPIWPLISMAMTTMIWSGVLGEGSAGPVLKGPEQADRISQVPEHRSVGQWLSYLGRVVRQAHGRSLAIVSDVTMVARGKVACQTVLGSIQPHGQRSEALTLPHLVDLPPPVT